MTTADLQVLLPLLLIAGTILVLLLVSAFHQSHKTAFVLALVGQLAALGGILFCIPRVPHAVGSLLRMDDYALFYLGLILIASIAVTMLSHGYLERHGLKHEEYYLALLLATLGAAVLVASTHFASFFIGLELLTVSLYVLIAYNYHQAQSLEGAVKYLILAAVSSAFLLFGMALIYAELGTLEFAQLATRLAAKANYRAVFILAGTAFMVAGIGFKLAVVPFHFWTPDVYQGAPAPVTAFLATVSKGSVVAVLLRYVTAVNLLSLDSVYVTLSVMAVASMVVGNVLALQQQNVKRMLAYGSIAHLGYLLVALLAGGTNAATAVTFYLVAYFASTLGVFGLIGHLSSGDREADRLEDFRGLFWRRPGWAALFTIMLLSLVGLPLTAGFIGKFFIIMAGVRSTLWFLVLMVVATSVVGLFYYMRVVAVMYSTEQGSSEDRPPVAPHFEPRSATIVLTLLAVILLWMGVYPKPALALIQRVITVLHPDPGRRLMDRIAFQPYGQSHKRGRGATRRINSHPHRTGGRETVRIVRGQGGEGVTAGRHMGPIDGNGRRGGCADEVGAGIELDFGDRPVRIGSISGDRELGFCNYSSGVDLNEPNDFLR